MRPLTRRKFLELWAALGAGAAVGRHLDLRMFPASPAYASVQVPQTALPGAAIQPFVEPLTTFAGRRVNSPSLEIGMFEFQQRLLPASIYDALPGPYNRGTYCWGYAVGTPGSHAPPSYPGVTVEAERHRTTTVRYVNQYPENPVLRKYLTIDQTIHWADPLHQMGSLSPYAGPIPAVVHLHGGEDQSTSDGAPEAWFTSNGLHGPGYYTHHPTTPNAAVYTYPNTNEATTLWFHDHTLGITRLTVFAGLAGFYLLRDQYDTGRPNNPLRLPAGEQEVDLMIQDRQFDTNGQLLFPDSALNPSIEDGPPGNPTIHPFWISEFFGDTMLVNGRTWPFLNVEPRRYRFRCLNASNARVVALGLADASTGAVGPPMYQIGTDGGLLDEPVKLTGAPGPYTRMPRPTVRLLLDPSERADIIVDFAGQAGKTFNLTNDAQMPFPSGPPLAANSPNRNVMQFRVTLALSSPDNTYDPAGGQPLRGGHNQPPAIIRLSNPSTGTLAPGVHPSVKRQLTLFEMESPTSAGNNNAGMPVIDLVNNTKWNGRRDGGGYPVVPGSRQPMRGQDVWVTETPRVGATEIWEFLNLTVDAHPIHIHLVQFQLLNRQAVVADVLNALPTYAATWGLAFPGGIFNGETANGTWGPVRYPKGTVIPGYGPPGNYTTPNADGALGGNP
ncbi:MAG TPA: multicopper oxidase domain-containing protein, partial [Nitrospirales bacterium]|nr:multicopper oxidase domain-containing protein [Nitrospirales bacterium]